MSFLNAFMLAGAGALSIPVIIHLLNRSRFKVVNWGAMHLLEQIMRRNRRRIRLEQWLLLLIRAAIPLLLALVMARPVLTGWQRLMGDAPSSLALIIDGSYSMQADAGARSRLDVARDAGARLLRELPEDSQAHVLISGSGVRPVTEQPTYDLEGLAERLTELGGDLGPAHSPAAIEAGLSALQGTDAVKRDLVIVSDFQRINWADQATGDRARIQQRLRDFEIQPSVTFFRVGEGLHDNVAVTGVDVWPRTIGKGQRVRIRVTVHNHGTQDHPAATVRLAIDGADADQRQVSLGPDEQKQVLFLHRFHEGGSHRLRASIELDSLEADNVYYHALEVVQRMRVLLVSGAPSRRFPEGETDWLNLALQPFANARDGGEDPTALEDLIETTVVSEDELDEQAIDQARVIVLANVEKLSESQLDRLDTFVSRGGGLVVFLGDRINAAWYNAQLGPEGRALVPATLSGISGLGIDFNRAGRIVTRQYSHPALTMWNDPSNGSLGEAEIRIWYALQPVGADDDSVHVMARLDTGQPLLVERQHGQGTTILCATSADKDWSNLPARGFYLPLMQQIVTYAASRAQPPRNLATGSRLVAHLPEAAAEGEASIAVPDGHRQAVQPRIQPGGSIVRFDPTRRQGFYELTTANGLKRHFAVNAPRAESDLNALTGEQLNALAEEMGAEVVSRYAQYAELDAARRYGTEIWKPLLLALVVLMFGELVFQQWIARRRMT